MHLFAASCALIFGTIHIVAGAWYAHKHRKFGDAFAEVSACHHEQCVMLAIIALAILYSN